MCPGTCEGKVTKKMYQKTIKEIIMFFEGKREKLVKKLHEEMNKNAEKQNFEQAHELKNKIYSLEHINDIALIKKRLVEGVSPFFRIEGYDVSHTFGKNAIGVMVVLEDGVFKKSEYRVFNIKTSKGGDDISSLREILKRRLAHKEWQYPNLIVIDGGKTHLRSLKKTIKDEGYSISVVSVVKDINHKAREILGGKMFFDLENNILNINTESHRFSLAKHKNKRRLIQ